MSRAALGIVVALLAAAGACTPAPPPAPTDRLQVADVLGGQPTAGFARATEDRDFRFPADHGPHPDFRAEWWYATGNVSARDGRHFGYQLTIFRTALAPVSPNPARSSAWATRDLYMAHFALTDVDGERFYAFDRFGRGALGLAGARAAPWRVWLDDWSLQQVGPEPFPLRLQARQQTASGTEIGIDLRVSPAKQLVLQGDRGLSRKGSQPGNASYYYSFTRLQTEGTVQADGGAHEVEGYSWLDREWSTSALEADQVGWDWFALQLDDGRELMFYQIRRRDGTAAPQSAGVLVDADGTTAPLSLTDIELRVEGTWESPIDGTPYPAAWTLEAPGLGLALRIEPFLPNQELDLAFRYWEGAVRVSGTVGGTGYVELTGYSLGTRPDDPPPTGSR